MDGCTNTCFTKDKIGLQLDLSQSSNSQRRAKNMLTLRIVWTKLIFCLLGYVKIKNKAQNANLNLVSLQRPWQKCCFVCILTTSNTKTTKTYWNTDVKCKVNSVRYQHRGSSEGNSANPFWKTPIIGPDSTCSAFLRHFKSKTHWQRHLGRTMQALWTPK